MTEPEYMHPDWSYGGRVHNWRNYISEEIRANWETFTPEQKRMLYESAEESAGREEWE